MFLTKDFYEEKGVVAKGNEKRTLTVIVLGVIVLVTLVIGVWKVWPALVITLVAGFTFVKLFRTRYIEYDYCFTNEVIEITKIKNRKRSLTALSFDLNNIYLIAPPDSQRVLNEQDKEPGMRFTDYTALEPSDKVYAFVLHLKGVNTVILMEPTESMMDYLRKAIPGKVYED